jgi:predicted transcriptional regulator
MENQSRTEIAIQILEIAIRDNIGEDKKTGNMQTAIMHKAVLSYSELKEYLKVLSESNLITYDSASRKFKITEKGCRLLELYNKVRNVIKEKSWTNTI